LLVKVITVFVPSKDFLITNLFVVSLLVFIFILFYLFIFSLVIIIIQLL